MARDVKLHENNLVFEKLIIELELWRLSTVLPLIGLYDLLLPSVEILFKSNNQLTITLMPAKFEKDDWTKSLLSLQRAFYSDRGHANKFKRQAFKPSEVSLLQFTSLCTKDLLHKCF